MPAKPASNLKRRSSTTIRASDTLPAISARARAIVRNLVQVGLRRAGLKLIRDPGPPAGEAALRRIRGAGMVPRTIIDVGAAFGDWTRECARLFPECQFVLFEPVDEYHPILEQRFGRFANVSLIRGAAGSASGSAIINVHQDLVGSSLLRETEGAAVNGLPRTVPTWRVDDIVEARSLPAPFFVKVDVQGAELQVLEGAGSTLNEALGVQLEISFFDFFVDGAPLDRVLTAMRDRGFVVYDVFGATRRPIDGALAQSDVMFVQETAPVRSIHAFASLEQRRQQDAALQAEFLRRSAESRRAR